MAERAGVEFEDFARSGVEELLGFARVVCSDRGLAEDIVQEVLLNLYRRRDGLATISNLPAYARRMVVNEVLSRRRAWSRLPRWPGPRRQPDAPDLDSGVVDRAWLKSALETLPPRQRVTVAMRYYLDLSDAVIAAELGCSVSTVRSQISRALDALRAEVGQPSLGTAKEVAP